MTSQEVMTKYDIRIDMRFVPWSQSRSYKDKATLSDYSLNYKTALIVKGRKVLECDYTMGQGPCPAYKAEIKDKYAKQLAIKEECEKGKAVKIFPNSLITYPTKTLITPKPEDVLYSLIMDSDVLNYATYEEWSSSLGYDADSRKGEAIYRACLASALAIRAAIGEAGLSELTEAFQDY